MKSKILKFLTLAAAFCGMTTWGATVATQEDLDAAITNASDGDTIEVGAGNYNLGSVGKSLKFVGVGEPLPVLYVAVSSDGSQGTGISGGDLEFSNLKLTGPASGYNGFTSTGALTFENVTFDVGFSNWGNQGKDVVFRNCTFNQNAGGRYCIQEFRCGKTVNVLIDGCTFNNSAEGRFINAYMQGGSAKTVNLVVKDCTFNNTGSSTYAAVYLKDDYADGCNVNLTFVGTNTATGNFPSTNTGSALCATKSKGHATISIQDSLESEPFVIYQNNAQTSVWIDPNGYTPASAAPAVAKIGDVEYETLAEAIAAATVDQTVEIVKAGTYTLPASIASAITVKGAENTEVVIDLKGGASTSIASLANGVTFENLVFDCNDKVNYRGFYSSSTTTFRSCTFNGEYWSYGTKEIFDTCTFNQNKADSGNRYALYVYDSEEVVLDTCTFNTDGKAVKIAKDEPEPVVVRATDSTFNSTIVNKNAFMFDTQHSAITVIANNCTFDDEYQSDGCEGGKGACWDEYAVKPAAAIVGTNIILDDSGKATSGTVTQIFGDIIAEGYEAKNNTSGTQDIVVKNYVAQPYEAVVDETTTMVVYLKDDFFSGKVTDGSGAAVPNPTVEQQNAYVNMLAPNGLKVWQNYVMGVDGSVEGNQLLTDYVVGGGEGPGEWITVKTPIAEFNPPADSGITVKYVLKSTTTPEDAESWVAVGEPKDTPSFPVNIAGQEGDTYWKIEAVFSGEAANE